MIKKFVDLTGEEFFSPKSWSDLQQVFEDFKSLPALKIVVGGTNGKGETCRRIASTLESYGKSVAVFSSPHVLKINERFYFGEDCRDELLDEALISFASKYPENNIKLSFYELTFWCFLWILKNKYENQVDVIVLEVGLGGRLDAVNLLDSDISVITSISRDHTEVLGNRYDLILKEKLGITREGKVLFFNSRLKYLNQIAENYCKKENIKNLYPPLVNDDYSLQNQRTALSVCGYILGFEIPPSIKKEPLGRGRNEILFVGNKKVLLNNSHNIDGHRQYLKKMKSFDDFKEGRIVLAFSKRPVVEISSILKMYIEYFKLGKISIYNGEFFKCLDSDLLSNLAISHEIELINDIEFLFSRIKNDKKENYILTGSHYFLGEVLRMHESLAAND